MAKINQHLELLEELSAFLSCGYQPGEMIDLLTSELGRRYRQRLRRGQPWSAVWELEPEMSLLLRSSELNGRFRDFIALALEHYRNRVSLQNTLRQKAAYPALTLVLTLLMLLGFVFFLLPLFNNLTTELGGQKSSAWLHWALLGCITVLFINYRTVYRLVMEHTGLGGLAENLRILQLLVLTEQAGIPLANFLAEYLKANTQTALAKVYFYLAKGLSAGEALAKAEIFDREEVRLLTIGGGANYVRGLNYLLQEFRQKYQNKIDKIIFYFEPGLLLFSGTVMAFCAWGFFRPLFSYAGIDF